MHDPDGETDERQLNVKVNVRKRLGRIGDDQQYSGDRIYGEAGPHNAEQTLEWRERDGARNSKEPQIDHHIRTY